MWKLIWNNRDFKSILVCLVLGFWFKKSSEFIPLPVPARKMAIPFASKLRHERIDAIGEELCKAEHDVVLLQEIWSQSDYKKLCDKILPGLMHTHYWHSGVIGSGVCMFSKYPILETFAYRFSVNGYAHRILHGDWYGGKVVGLAKVAVSDFVVHFYTTHTHAEYCDEKYFADEYRAHRVAQAYELSEFVRLTGDGCDAVVVAGDLNLQPHELGYKVITANAALTDAWISQRQGPRDHAVTSQHPDNSFRSTHSPAPKCLDYVLYRGNTGSDVVCERCELALGQVPDQPYSFSDHDGVAATLTVKRNVTAMTPSRDSAALEECLPAAQVQLLEGMRAAKAARWFYAVVCVLAVVLLGVTHDVGFPLGLDWFLVFLRGALVLVAGASLWMGLIVELQNYNGLLAANININRLLSR